MASDGSKMDNASFKICGRQECDTEQASILGLPKQDMAYVKPSEKEGQGADAASKHVVSLQERRQSLEEMLLGGIFDPDDIPEIFGSPKQDKAYMTPPEQEGQDADAASGRVMSLQERLKSLRGTSNKWEEMLLGGIVDPNNIPIRFSDVRVPASTIESLQSLVTLSLVRPDAFTYGVLANNKILGILLYGPPGTGKTHLAKAVAKESGATMLHVSGADILQKYVGESEKVIRAIFSLARKLDPCIIFIDEADAVFRARSSDERQHHREMITEFLLEWDGIASSVKAGLVLLATNRPYDLDDAVLRRVPRRILIDMPTTEDREAILNIYLKDEVLDPDVNIASIASMSPNFTGSDLKNLCVAAAFACIYEEVRSVNDDPSGEAPLICRKARLRKERFPPRRILRSRHFTKAIEEVSASVTPGSIAKCRDFQHKRSEDNRIQHLIEPPRIARGSTNMVQRNRKSRFDTGILIRRLISAIFRFVL